MPSEEELPLSGLMPLMVGAAGAVVSIVTAKALEADPVLPAASVAVAVSEWLPAARLLASVQAPDPSAVAVPSVVLPSLTRTVALASALPAMVSAVALVMPSVAELPVSGLMPLIVGAAGAVVSTVTAKALEAAPVLPARSVAVAVSEWLPAVNVPAKLHAPEPSAVALPSTVAPSFTVTIALASALPEMV